MSLYFDWESLIVAVTVGLGGVALISAVSTVLAPVDEDSVPPDETDHVIVPIVSTSIVFVLALQSVSDHVPVGIEQVTSSPIPKVVRLLLEGAVATV